MDTDKIISDCRFLPAAGRSYSKFAIRNLKFGIYSCLSVCIGGFIMLDALKLLFLENMINYLVNCLQGYFFIRLIKR